MIGVVVMVLLGRVIMRFVERTNAGLKDPDLVDDAFLARDHHMIAITHGAQHDQHHACGDVGQRILQRQADCQARCTEHCDQRGRWHADLTQRTDEHQHQQQRVHHVAQEVGQRHLHARAGECAVQPLAELPGQPHAGHDDQECDAPIDRVLRPRDRCPIECRLTGRRRFRNRCSRCRRCSSCSCSCGPQYTRQSHQLSLLSLARRNQVSTTVSGFNDTDSMPSCISHSASSG